MKRSVALIGSGNVFFKDEGLGLYAAKYLKDNYTFEPDLEIIDGGILGFRLMSLLQEYDHVIIANTSSSDEYLPGHIEVMDTSDLLGEQGIKKTANEVEITEMLQICSMADKVAGATMISMIPEDIVSVEVDLSPIVRERWDDYLQTILDILTDQGIKSIKNETSVHVDEILEIFANPSIEHQKGF